MVAGAGGYIWFIGLGLATLAVICAVVYATMRKQKPGGDPNHAWKQAAAETGHPEVARPEAAPRA